MLKITRLADYAVLIICSFDTCKDKIVSSQEIINKTGLQKATVNKVLSILVRKKILEAHRGVNGGYKPFKKLEFKVSNEKAWDVGLACGGEISIFLEQIKT